MPDLNIECVVRSADQLGETPLWCDRERRLWWLDIEKPRLQGYDPATDQHTVQTYDCNFLGSQALCSDGSRLLALDLGLHRYSNSGQHLSTLAHLEHGLDNRLNDGRVDAQGRLWIGTMDNQLHRPQGALYRIDPDGGVHRMLDGVIVSNGISFSPDGRRMTFTDTRRYISWLFDVDPDSGTLLNQRVWADYGATRDRPDGACVDVDGCTWQAFFGGGRVVRYTPDGRIDRVLPLPVSNPTCLCFGGADLRTLYVTSAAKFLSPEQRASEPLAGSLFAIHGMGQGLPENRFRVLPPAGRD